MNFWKRNEGQITGTIGSGFVAIFAAFLASWLTLNQINHKEHNRYQGLLYTLHVELYWQDNQFKLLEQTIKELKSVSIENHTFVINDAPMQIDLSIVDQCLTNMIDYKNFNHGLVALLTSYRNQIKDLNFYLDFKNANDVIVNRKDLDNLDIRIEDYFRVLESEYIKKAQVPISDIRKLIESELDEYHKAKLILRKKNSP